MRDRLWHELTQCKHHITYCNFVISYQRRVLNWFNILILIFSTAGVMGWKFWDSFPGISCAIICGMSLIKLVSPNIIASEEKIQKLCKVSEFYVDYFDKIEVLWFDHYYGRINDQDCQKKFYELRSTENDTNKAVNEIIKRTNKNILKKTEKETVIYFERVFKTNNS